MAKNNQQPIESNKQEEHYGKIIPFVINKVETVESSCDKPEEPGYYSPKQKITFDVKFDTQEQAATANSI